MAYFPNSALQASRESIGSLDIAARGEWFSLKIMGRAGEEEGGEEKVERRRWRSLISTAVGAVGGAGFESSTSVRTEP